MEACLSAVCTLVTVSCLYCFVSDCLCPLGLGGSSNVLAGGWVRFSGEFAVLVNRPFWWTYPFGDG